MFSDEVPPRDHAIAALVGALHRSEALAGALVAEQARLAAAAIAAEQALGLSATASHGVIAMFVEAQRQASDARMQLVGGHRRLEALGRRLGLDVTMYGDTGKPPEDDDEEGKKKAWISTAGGSLPAMG